MPKILNRLVQQIMASGKSRDAAYPIAVSQLHKHGILKKDSLELTPHGRVRDAMTPKQRAISRARKHNNGEPASAYSYDPKTNRATLKEKK